MNEKTNYDQSQHNTNAMSVPYKQPKPDEKTVYSRLGQGIPFLLAQVVPAEMRITSLEIKKDGRPIYAITKALIYGTAEDIVEYLMDNSLLCDPDVEVDIAKVGEEEGIEGLYVLYQFILGGDEVGIVNHFGC